MARPSPQASEEPPILSAADFGKYNRMAEHMEYFVKTHFLSSNSITDLICNSMSIFDQPGKPFTRQPLRANVLRTCH